MDWPNSIIAWLNLPGCLREKINSSSSSRARENFCWCRLPCNARRRDTTRHVTIDNGVRLVVSDAENGTRRVVPNARERASFVVTGGEDTVKILHDFLCSTMQIARPAVVPESGPQFQHPFKRRPGQTLYAGERLKKPLEIRNDGVDLSLLEHHLRDPHGVRVFVLSPR